MNKSKIKTLLIVLAIVVSLLIVVALWVVTGDRKEKEQMIKIGFIMSGAYEEKGWNGLHYDGVKAACDELGMELIVKESVKEHSGQCEDAIKDLAKEDVDIIILSSYGYAEEAEEVVKEYPDITFYSTSFDYYGDNLNCYFARIYQARYLSGIIAGHMSDTDVVGYVAAMPNNEVNRGINAFTLGVKKANPDAKVVVAWSDSWDDADREKQLAKELIEKEHVDVLGYHQNKPNVIEVTEDLGIYSIGYHEAYEGGSEKFLTAVEFRWDMIYKELLSDYAKGKSDVVNTYWFGLEKDAIGLTDVSTVVPSDVIADVETAKKELVDGDRIFSGIIYDNQGNVRCRDGEMISDQVLTNNMDWYVEGVEVYGE
ncbi:MAG: BMP family ABC transporter substrate-binding protein [Lachnospiraceae bacterium]|nr:BMP family ABC transporter substrate-binding protein [Lachnospiraceae bacterium]